MNGKSRKGAGDIGRRGVRRHERWLRGASESDGAVQEVALE